MADERTTPSEAPTPWAIDEDGDIVDARGELVIALAWSTEARYRIAARVVAAINAAECASPELAECDGQPDEAQEWRDFDPDC